MSGYNRIDNEPKVETYNPPGYMQQNGPYNQQYTNSSYEQQDMYQQQTAPPLYPSGEYSGVSSVNNNGVNIGSRRKS